MRIVVVGGKLQGVEATYLAHQADWEVILIDQDELAPATGLCDEFYRLDVTKNQEELGKVIKSADLIIPAIEDDLVHQSLIAVAGQKGIPVALDANAYKISSSKRESDQLFQKIAIPAPRYWPDGTLPVIIKPSGLSGSKDVRKLSSADALAEFLHDKREELDHWVIQEFLEGPSYSLEIMGCRGNYITLQTTDLEMDSQYDCQRVLAPTNLALDLEMQLRQIAVKIAGSLKLTGIMDVEIINHNGSLKVLEIDARLPSQTPTVVYKSTGVNMLTQLYDIYVRGILPDHIGIALEKAVIYEHIQVCNEGLQTLGEHIMTTAGPLKYYRNFFGADEAITSYKPGSTSWVATIILTGSNYNEVLSKRSDVIENIKRRHKINPILEEN